MGNKAIDRIGEKNINNFESEIVIVEYRKWNNIDVYFPEYDWTFKNANYSNFKKGNIKCPYGKSVYGIGYFGEGKYKSKENGKRTRVYKTWHDMLKRCYDPKYHEKYLTYKDCNTSEKWLNFQNFGEWDSENYYEVEGERMHLDKDILIKGNKIYSPDACIYVPQTINNLFVKNDKKRGEYPIGVCHLENSKYMVCCHLIDTETGKSKRKTLGYYDTEIEAFEVYKYHKEKNIKLVADYYKEQIPAKLYETLYNYQVEITD